MQKPTHIAFTATVGASLLMINPTFSLFYLLLPFFAILPDADHGKDSISRKLSVNIGKKRVGLKIPGKHRGWTHTLYFPLLVMGLFYLLFSHIGINLVMWDYIVGAILILSHSFADMFTVSGIKPLYLPSLLGEKLLYKIPFIGNIIKFISEFTVKIPIATTGKKSEYRVLTIVLIILLFLIVKLFLSGTLDVFLKGYINFFNSDSNITLYAIIVSYLVLFFFLGKELTNVRKNSKILFSFLIKMLGIGLVFFIIGFVLIRYLPDSFEYKKYILLGIIFVFLSVFYYFFNKHMHRLMPILIYTILGILYTGLVGVLLYKADLSKIRLDEGTKNQLENIVKKVKDEGKNINNSIQNSIHTRMYNK